MNPNTVEWLAVLSSGIQGPCEGKAPSSREIAGIKTVSTISMQLVNAAPIWCVY
jgi:hypothetical protein